jgi:hypothetical protein
MVASALVGGSLQALRPRLEQRAKSKVRTAIPPDAK